MRIRSVFVLISLIGVSSLFAHGRTDLDTYIQGDYGEYGGIQYQIIDPNTGELVAGGPTQQPGNWVSLTKLFFDRERGLDRWRPGPYQIIFLWRAGHYFASGTGLLTYLGDAEFAESFLARGHRGTFLALAPIRLSLF